MRTVLRRVLVLGSLLFWQGGFTFYGAVVVHVGQDVLGSHRTQGFVTRRVTNYLNLSGAVALPLLAWDTAASAPRSGRLRALRRLRWACWAGMALTLAVLVWLHGRLDALLDAGDFTILDPKRFSAEHRWYLHASTVQWLCAIVCGVLSVWTWREQDRDTGTATTARESPVTGEPGC